MAKVSGGGLLLAALLVLFLGYILYDIVIESEDSASDSCDTANEGDEPGNETCDSRDRKFLGMGSWIYILVVLAACVGLAIAGIIKLYRS